MNVLRRGLLGLSIVEGVCLIGKKAKATFIGTLKRCERVLIQLFTPGLLLRALRLKLLSSKVYHSRAKSRRDIAILAFTRIALRKMTKL